MIPCALCHHHIYEGQRGVLLKEHDDLHDDDLWDEGLPIALDGTHYVALHMRCWDAFYERLSALDKGASFMFFMGDVRDLQEVVMVA